MMNEFESKKSRKKRHPIRNFFVTVLLAAVLFLAALFGDIFPGLNDFRDSLLEQQTYSISNHTEDNAKSAAKSSDEIIISEYDIYYMGERITLNELSAKLDAADLMDVTLSDYQGTAKQKTWLEVSLLLSEKGLAFTEKVIE